MSEILGELNKLDPNLAIIVILLTVVWFFLKREDAERAARDDKDAAYLATLSMIQEAQKKTSASLDANLALTQQHSANLQQALANMDSTVKALGNLKCVATNQK